MDFFLSCLLSQSNQAWLWHTFLDSVPLQRHMFTFTLYFTIKSGMALAHISWQCSTAKPHVHLHIIFHNQIRHGFGTHFLTVFHCKAICSPTHYISQSNQAWLWHTFLDSVPLQSHMFTYTLYFTIKSGMALAHISWQCSTAKPHVHLHIIFHNEIRHGFGTHFLTVFHCKATCSPSHYISQSNQAWLWHTFLDSVPLQSHMFTFTLYFTRFFF